MTLLAVETTSAMGSLCLADIQKNNFEILSTRSWQKKSSHSEIITLELEAGLKEADLKLAVLTHLAIDNGPGSFTGIRVGLNLIRSLSYALNLPVRNFCSLEVLAFQNLKVGESAVIAIPAVQDFYYGGVYLRNDAGIQCLRPVESMKQARFKALQESTKVEQIVL